MLEFVHYSKYNLLDYIFKKKSTYRISIEYQILLNESIKVKSEKIVRMIIMEARRNKAILLIQNASVEYLAEIGAFQFIRFLTIVELEDYINLSGYIRCITNGISKYMYRNDLTSEDVFRYVEELRCLSLYLTRENKNLLNDVVEKLYSIQNINNGSVCFF
jgi:hypothetical protein